MPPIVLLEFPGRRLSPVPVNRKNNTMDSQCRNGHIIKGPRDLFADGECRECDRAYQAKYRTRRGQAMTLLRTLEKAGINTSDIDRRAVQVAATLTNAGWA